MEYAAYVGIDWSSEKHDFEVVRSDGTESEKFILPHDGATIRGYFKELSAGISGRVAVCLEQSRGPLFSVLNEIPGIDIFPVNPATLCRYRKAFDLSGAKDDSSDAGYARELVQHHRDKLRKSPGVDSCTEKINTLSRYRRDAVDDRARGSLKLRDALKSYFPQVLELFDNLWAPICLSFLDRWLELRDVQKESDETIIKFFCSHHSSKELKNQQRLEFIRKTEPLIKSRSVIEPAIMHVQRLCAELKTLNESIAKFDKKLETLVPCHQDYQIFKSFPGAGTNYTARLISAFGINRDRFRSAEDFANYHGVSPVQIQSGKTRLIVARKAKPYFSHQTLVEWTGETIKKCPWARSFYSNKRARGSTHRVAIRALAFKWCRILFTCWKNNTPYKEQL